VQDRLAVDDWSGAEERALDVVSSNSAELPVVGALGQLLRRRGAVREAESVFAAAVSDLARLTRVASAEEEEEEEGGRQQRVVDDKKPIPGRDAAFAQLQMALAMVNVDLDATKPVLFALAAAPDFLHEELARAILAGLTPSTPGWKNWLGKLLQHGASVLPSRRSRKRWLKVKKALKGPMNKLWQNNLLQTL
jgi:hypothetical protein